MGDATEVVAVEVGACRHPAKYTDAILERIAEIVIRHDVKRLLDSHAGVGKIAKVRDYGFTGEIYGVELEREWAEQAPTGVHVVVGDAKKMPFEDDFFDCEAVSPTYGNRMADHHNANDGSRRNTYTHAKGAPLQEGNTGVLRWGEAYRHSYYGIWAEQRRVLCDGALFVLNCKDHIRGGEVMPVTEWHVRCLESLGFEEIERYEVPVRGNGFGSNHEKRIPFESVVVFRLNKHRVVEQGRLFI